ncbi:MAG TPA: hypothetical protein DDY78_21210 [Planctomycetales bacterium]|jgi:hypothetical protein|nr:hypothetical protein [Planctomycetales bacterium]
MNLLVALLLAAAPGPVASDFPPDAAALEKAVLDYRRAIQNGKLVLTQRTYLEGEASPSRSRVTTIWFDGTRIRNDAVFRFAKSEPPHRESDEAPHREVYCRNCEFDGYYIDYNSYTGQTGDVMPSLHLERLDLNADRNRYQAVDPRLLGVVLGSFPNLSSYRLDANVGALDRKGVTIQNDTWKGVECRRIDFKNPAGMDGRIWIVPAWGPNVVRIQTEGDGRGHHYLFSVESEYQKIEPSGIWYPQTCTFERRADNKLEEKEEIGVQVLSMNEPVDPNAFRLAGMEIPAGTYVAGFRAEGPSTWNGKELVPQAPPDLLTNRAKPGAVPWTQSEKWPYAIGSLILALFAAGAVWLYTISNKHKPRPEKG